MDAPARGAPLRRAEAGTPPAPVLPPSCAGAHGDRRPLAELLLERQGIVTRCAVRAEGIPGGYGAVYAELRALETLGLCRRGYFVEGLRGGEAVLYVERGGRSLVPLRDPHESWLRPALEALVAHVRERGGKRLAVERFDGEPVGESEIMPLLLDVGFLA